MSNNTLNNTLNNLTDVKHELIDIYNTLHKDHSNFDDVKANVKHVLERYKGIDWKKYIVVETYNYHRHTLFTSKEFDIIIITWAKGQQCPIHNHPNNGCNVKILDGNITEERYNKETFKELYTYTYYKDDIMYIDDNLGYHRMCNNGTIPCITLHIYAPGYYKPIYFADKINNK
jgi:cysteine dioxygenase